MAQQAFLAAQARRYAEEGQGSDLQARSFTRIQGKTGDQLKKALFDNKSRLEHLFEIWDECVRRPLLSAAQQVALNFSERVCHYRLSRKPLLAQGRGRPLDPKRISTRPEDASNPRLRRRDQHSFHAVRLRRLRFL